WLQRTVLEKNHAADSFALAPVIDAEGASDVFAIVILEGMACGRAVVSTRLAGIPELVVDGETGTLISPGDTAPLTDALQRLLCDRELRLRYGRTGRARIERHFQIEDTVSPLVELLDNSVRKHRDIDLQSVRPAGLEPAGSHAASKVPKGSTGKMPMFR